MESGCKEKVHIYIENVKGVLKQLKEYLYSEKGTRRNVRDIISLADAYLRDAKYYLTKGDICTALACISYSEGLLDAIRYIGMINFEWPKHRMKPRRKVLVGGVFDILHIGHLYFLKKASELGNVTVVVARDSTVRSLKKREPIIPEKQRVEIIKALKFVDEAILGEEPLNIRKILKKVKPNIIVLGPDQDYLKSMIETAARDLGLSVEITVIAERVYDNQLASTSSIISKIVKQYSHKEQLSDC